MIVQSQQSSASAPFYPDFLGRNSTVSLFEKLDQRQVAVGVSRSPGEFAILEACSLGAARPHRDEHLTIFSYSFAAGTNFKFCNVLHIKQFTCTDPNRLHWWHPIGISSRTRLPRSINGWKNHVLRHEIHGHLHRLPASLHTHAGSDEVLQAINLETAATRGFDQTIGDFTIKNGVSPWNKLGLKIRRTVRLTWNHGCTSKYIQSWIV